MALDTTRQVQLRAREAARRLLDQTAPTISDSIIATSDLEPRLQFQGAEGRQQVVVRNHYAVRGEPKGGAAGDPGRDGRMMDGVGKPANHEEGVVVMYGTGEPRRQGGDCLL